LKKSIAIVSFGDAGGESEALRQAAECFGYSVLKYGIGRPQDFIDIISGKIPHVDCIIISCHGGDSGIVMPKLGQDIYLSSEPQGDFGALEIDKYLALKDTCIVNLGCATGAEDMARAFTKNNNTYIAPVDYVEGSSSLIFAISLLYHASQNGFDIADSYRKASSTDSETGLFVLKK